MSVTAKLCVSVVIFHERNVLLVEEKDGKFNLPTGHVEKNESPYKAACRELWEETGLLESEDGLRFIDITPIGETLLERKSGNYFTKVYLGKTKAPAHHTVSDEDVVRFHWMDVRDVFGMPCHVFRNPLVIAKIQMGSNVVVYNEHDTDYFVRVDAWDNIFWG